MKPLHVFYHIARMGNWQSVVQEQVELLESSGLLDTCQVLHVTALSPDRILEFEFPTLAALQRLAQAEDCYCLYLHTKGVRTGLENIADWRRMMQYFLVSRWEEAVAKLDEGYDCVGCEPGFFNWEPPRDYFHFAGNFWWVTSDFIQRLPAIESLNLEHREQAEAWIGMAGVPNHYVAYRSGVDHNHSSLPREVYEGKGYE